MQYTVGEILKTIDCLSNIFDIARVIDPIEMKIISFNKSDEIVIEEYTNCYNTWNKNEVCENCISIKALYSGRRMTKYEFINDEVYHVVVKPIEILLNDKTAYKYILELVNEISDEVMFEAIGKEGFIEKIMSYEKKIYCDSLTEAYNRRYFDEGVFLNNYYGHKNNDMTFLFADLKQFKKINDTYGHDVGDWVLVNTVKTIKSCINKNDAVIRMGGDEFLIILKNYNITSTEAVLGVIKDRLKSNVVYDKENNKYAVANFGMAHTSNFVFSSELINNMMEEADRKMYLDKKNS